MATLSVLEVEGLKKKKNLVLLIRTRAEGKSVPAPTT